MAKRELLILADSSQGKSLGLNGSSFDVVFDTPIKASGEPTLRLLSANVWYTFPNITSSNNLLLVKYGNDPDALTTLPISIPKGLYGLEELNDALQYQLVQDGLASDALGSDAVTIHPNYATGKCILRLSLVNGVVSYLQVDWDQSTISPMLGFTGGVDTLSGVGRTFLWDSNQVANISPISSLQVHCSVCRGSCVNGTSDSDVIAEISLDASPGHTIMFRPFHTPRVLVRSEAFLSGITRMHLSLTDQTGKPVDTNGEYWNISLLLEY